MLPATILVFPAQPSLGRAPSHGEKVPFQDAEVWSHNADAIEMAWSTKHSTQSLLHARYGRELVAQQRRPQKMTTVVQSQLSGVALPTQSQPRLCWPCRTRQAAPSTHPSHHLQHSPLWRDPALDGRPTSSKERHASPRIPPHHALEADDTASAPSASHCGHTGRITVVPWARL
jgi:hypothetical protein